jgi:Sodium/hydrogen exchanger family
VFPQLNLWTAAALATMLVPTDAALGLPVVTNPRLPSRIRQGLNVESGLNDGVCVPLLIICLTIAQAEEGVGHVQPLRDGGGVHADRARQQRPDIGWPGFGLVVPGAGQAQQDPEHVDQPDRQVLMSAEEDGGDLADQPDQPTGGEQQRRHDQPEGVGDELVVAVGVAVMPPHRHLPAVHAPRGARPGTRPGRWR